MSDNENQFTPSQFNFPNVMANLVLHVEQEIDEAVDESRIPWNATVSVSETGNSYIFENIKFEENDLNGIDSKATVFVARREVGEEPDVKRYYQICIDSYVDGLLMGQFRHATDSAMFERAREAYEFAQQHQSVGE